MYLILLGLPGAGKGTQAVRLTGPTGLAHITTGELFRENIRRQTDLGKKTQPYVEKGLLVPDEITIGMLLERISQPDCALGCMLDGFPRNLEQAQALDGALGQRETAIDKTAYIKVSTDELVWRLGGRWNCRGCTEVYHESSRPPKVAAVCDNCGAELYQREDDRPEVVHTRLEVNLARLEPLLQYYRQQGKLVEIDGEQERDAVGEQLMAALGLVEAR